MVSLLVDERPLGFYTRLSWKGRNTWARCGSRPTEYALAELITTRLVAAVLDQVRLPLHGIHGPAHWGRVHDIGLRLAAESGARVQVVQLFALFHDACRHSEGSDPRHGERGAALARRLRGRYFQLGDRDQKLLVRACAGHTRGGTRGDVTVLTCWAADRLDLPRVGTRVDPRQLGIAAARDAEMIAWASRRARDQELPLAPLRAWGIAPRALRRPRRRR